MCDLRAAGVEVIQHDGKFALALGPLAYNRHVLFLWHRTMSVIRKRVLCLRMFTKKCFDRLVLPNTNVDKDSGGK